MSTSTGADDAGTGCRGAPDWRTAAGSDPAEEAVAADLGGVSGT